MAGEVRNQLRRVLYHFHWMLHTTRSLTHCHGSICTRGLWFLNPTTPTRTAERGSHSDECVDVCRIFTHVLEPLWLLSNHQYREKSDMTQRKYFKYIFNVEFSHIHRLCSSLTDSAGNRMQWALCVFWHLAQCKYLLNVSLTCTAMYIMFTSVDSVSHLLQGSNEEHGQGNQMQHYDRYEQDRHGCSEMGEESGILCVNTTLWCYPDNIKENHACNTYFETGGPTWNQTAL